MKVLHIPCYSRKDPLKPLGDNIDCLKGMGSPLVVATAQHMNRLDDIVSFLRQNAIEAVAGGQVLGCNQDAALSKECDYVLYVGGGRFHPLGIAFKTKKRVFILDPLSGSFYELDSREREKYLRKKKGKLMKAYDSKVFGIMVSSKRGQANMQAAEEVKSLLESKGRKAYVFIGEELSPQNMMGFKVDCLVNTACPRIESDVFHVPCVNYRDLTEFFSMA